MQRIFNLPGLLVLISLVLMTSCAPTKFATVWKDEAYTGGHIKSVLVVGVAQNPFNRRLFEDIFTKQFKKKGIDAVPSYSVIPTHKGINKETVLSEAEKLGTSTILAANLLGVKEEYVHFDPLGYEPVRKANSFSTYFPAVTEYAHSPVSYTKIENVRLQTNLYERETEKLVWYTVTETFRPESVQEVIDSLCSAVMKSLRENKLLGR